MNGTDSSFLVVFRGRTLGPVSANQLHQSIRKGELLPKDRICAVDPSHGKEDWKSVEDVFPDFFPSKPRPKTLPVLPLVTSRKSNRQVNSAPTEMKLPAIAPRTEKAEQPVPAKPFVWDPIPPKPHWSSDQDYFLERPTPRETRPLEPHPHEERIGNIPKLYHWILAVSLIASALSLSLALWTLGQTKKTRDLELNPGPPSPLAEPQTPSDPVPELRAPARPTREPRP
jgi:hypothetical protein